MDEVLCGTGMSMSKQGSSARHQKKSEFNARIELAGVLFGEKYSKPMQALITPRWRGAAVPRRLLRRRRVASVGALIEAGHDENGIIWPSLSRLSRWGSPI